MAGGSGLPPLVRSASEARIVSPPPGRRRGADDLPLLVPFPRPHLGPPRPGSSSEAQAEQARCTAGAAALTLGRPASPSPGRRSRPPRLRNGRRPVRPRASAAPHPAPPPSAQASQVRCTAGAPVSLPARRAAARIRARDAATSGGAGHRLHRECGRLRLGGLGAPPSAGLPAPGDERRGDAGARRPCRAPPDRPSPGTVRPRSAGRRPPSPRTAAAAASAARSSAASARCTAAASARSTPCRTSRSIVTRIGGRAVTATTRAARRRSAAVRSSHIRCARRRGYGPFPPAAASHRPRRRGRRRRRRRCGSSRRRG